MKLPKYKDLTPEQITIYQSLTDARQRCIKKTHKKYHRYGGRGIRYLIDETKSRIWVVLQQEKAWMEAKRKYPDDVITINRINNDGDYTEDNIEWTSRTENNKQQHRDSPHNPAAMASAKANGRSVRCITTGEVFPSSRQAGRVFGIDYNQISRCCKKKKYHKTAGKTKDGVRCRWEYVR